MVVRTRPRGAPLEAVTSLPSLNTTLDIRYDGLFRWYQESLTEGGAPTVHQYYAYLGAAAGGLALPVALGGIIAASGYYIATEAPKAVADIISYVRPDISYAPDPVRPISWDMAKGGEKNIEDTALRDKLVERLGRNWSGPDACAILEEMYTTLLGLHVIARC